MKIKLPETNKEDLRLIKQVVRGLSGKSVSQKVDYVRQMTGVIIAEEEVRYPSELIRRIIEARFIQPCTECHGNGFDKKMKRCDVCNGMSYLRACDLERILLGRLVNKTVG